MLDEKFVRFYRGGTWDVLPGEEGSVCKMLCLSSMAASSHFSLSRYSIVILRLELGLRCSFLSDHAAFCMAEFGLLVTSV